MENFLANDSIFTLCIGIVMGLVTWDLAFETRSLKTTKDITMLRFYYQGLHQAHKFVLLLLPLSFLTIVSHLVYLGLQKGETVYWAALGLTIFAIIIEIFLAVPREIKLWKKLDTPAEDDQENIQKMIGMIYFIRNVHLTIFAILVAVVCLTR